MSTRIFTKSALAAASAMAVVAAAGTCSGQFIGVFDSRPSFVAEAPTLFTDDYESAAYAAIQNDASMNAVLGLTRYKTTAFANSDQVIAQNGQHVYAGGSSKGSFQLDFTAPTLGGTGVEAVGFDYSNNLTAPYVAFVTFADGTSQNFALHASAFAAAPLPDFFGLSSSVGITQIHIGLANGGATSANLFAIDNLSVSISPLQTAASVGGNRNWSAATTWSSSPRVPIDGAPAGVSYDVTIPTGRVNLDIDTAIEALSLGNAGTLNLASHRLVVQPQKPFIKANEIPVLAAAIRTGFNGGTWTGPGITSTTAAADPAHLGVSLFDNADLHLTSFAGQAVDDLSLLLMVAPPGDANGDGRVDAFDLNVVAAHFQQATEPVASQGDFNGDGRVDSFDLNVLAAHFQQAPTGALSSLALTVPEPGSLWLLAAGIVLLFWPREEPSAGTGVNSPRQKC